MEDLKLCFAKRLGPEMVMLYYTDKDASKVRGDDWDDIPYEHNAEAPCVEDVGVVETVIVLTDFPSEIKTPDDGYLNSPYSVIDVNKGDIPWLKVMSGNAVFLLKANSSLKDLYNVVKSGRVNMEIFRRDM